MGGSAIVDCSFFAFVDFFFANFVHCNIALFVVAGFMMATYPRMVRFLLFPPASLLLLGLWELWLRPVLLALPFCLFFFFFFAIFLLFCPFFVFGLFCNDDEFACF